MYWKIVFLFLILTPLWSLAKEGERTLQKPASALRETHQEARKSQEKIDRLDEETRRLLEEYRRTLNKTENLRIYNQELSSYIEKQKEEILETRKKIEEVKDTGKEIVPLMLRMLDSLSQFVDLDVPFQLAERKKRIQTLKETLGRSDVSLSEKYRQLISAYKIEQEYGRTLESYREIREVDGKELTVEYLRLGRLAFIYRSLDGRNLAYWNKKERQWEKLPRSYKKDVLKAIKVALKQVPPNMLKLPVPGKEELEESQ